MRMAIGRTGKMATLTQQRDKLHAEVIYLQLKLDQIAEEIQRFKAHLQTAKFVGHEVLCGHCNVILLTSAFVEGRCQSCDSDLSIGGFKTERKDMIATADVQRWLDGLNSTLS
jgi:hypothetical protein